MHTRDGDGATIEANLGDGPWWCALDAQTFEAAFLAPPPVVGEAQFDAWLARYEAHHGAPVESALDALDARCPREGGARRIDGREAGLFVYLVCVNECGVLARRGRHQKSPARTLVGLFSDRALARAGFQPLLEGAGFEYDWFRSGWRLLCKSAGFDLESAGAAKIPAWLQAAAGDISGYAGLLDPAEVRALGAHARAASGKTYREALSVVARRFDCPQDAEDLALLVELAAEVSPRGPWLLSVQAAT